MTTVTTSPRLSGHCRVAMTPGMAWMHGRCSGYLLAQPGTGKPSAVCGCTCRHGAR